MKRFLSFAVLILVVWPLRAQSHASEPSATIRAAPSRRQRDRPTSIHNRRLWARLRDPASGRHQQSRLERHVLQDRWILCEFSEQQSGGPGAFHPARRVGGRSTPAADLAHSPDECRRGRPPRARIGPGQDRRRRAPDHGRAAALGHRGHEREAPRPVPDLDSTAGLGGNGFVWGVGAAVGQHSRVERRDRPGAAAKCGLPHERRPGKPGPGQYPQLGRHVPRAAARRLLKRSPSCRFPCN